MQKQNQNSLVRDLIYVGVFGAVYMIGVVIISCLGYIPMMIPINPILISLLLSIPMFLFFSKIDHPILCCTLLSSILAGALLIEGHSINIFPLIIPFGFLAGLVLHFLGKTVKGISLAYIITGMFAPASILPLWISTKQYMKMAEHSCSHETVLFLTDLYLKQWVLPLIYVGSLIAATVGTLIANRAMKRHFKRIGLV